MSSRTFIQRYLVIVLIGSLFLPGLVFAQLVKLQHLNIHAIGKNTQIHFVFNAPFKYRHFILKRPSRLVFDFYSARLLTPVNKVHFNRHIIQSISSGVHKHHQIRIVFQFKEMPAFTIRRNKKHQLQLTLLSRINQHKPSSAEVVSNQIFKPVVTINEESQKVPLHEAVVIIDPGHGGKDPGAVGLRGTYEKNVVLAIAKELYDLLKKQPNIKPKMTRHGDYFVRLRNRLRLARKGHADLFVSIHADAYKNHYSHGASVFALSERGATSEAARWLAQKENFSELKGVGDVDNKSYMVRSVLIDLSQTATIQESLRLGNIMMYSLRKITPLHHNFVEQAPFMVLKSPDIPSLLVETGFISNRKTELKLRNPIYQHKVARALMLAIVDYLHQYPPPGTTLSAKYQHNIRHVVQPGETLMQISRKHHVKLLILKNINHLKNNNLKVGQVLLIPR